MLVFEDLHWADEMSLEVIGELARHAIGAAALRRSAAIAATSSRSDTIHREWRARLLSQRFAEEARLEPPHARGDGDRDDADPGRRAAGAARGRRGGPRADERDPAPHRGAPRGARRRELAPTAGGSARPTSRTRSATRCSRGSAACRRTPARSPAPAPSSAAASAPTSSRAWSTARSRSSSRRSRSWWTPRSSTRSTTSTSGYYDFRHQLLRDAIYGSVPPSQLRRFHAQAAEFVMTLEAVERRPRLAPLRAGRAPGAGLPGGDDRRRTRRAGSPPARRRVSSTSVPSRTCRPTCRSASEAELYRSFCDAAAAIERIDDCSLAAHEARRWFLEAGRIADAAEMLMAIANGERKNGRASIDRRRATDRPGPRRARDRPDDPAGSGVAGRPGQLPVAQRVRRCELRRGGATEPGVPRNRAGSSAIEKSTLEAEFWAAQIALVGGEDGMPRAARADRPARRATPATRGRRHLVPGRGDDGGACDGLPGGGGGDRRRRRVRRRDRAVATAASRWR